MTRTSHAIRPRLARAALGFLLGTATVVPLHAATIVALTTDNRLLQFESDDPCSVSEPVKVTGLAEGEALLGIDFRPANGALYALGSTSRVYIVDTATGAATAVNATPFTPALDGTDFGFDFNPTVDRLRIVSNTGQNLRYNPNTGAIAFVDTNLAYAIGDANEGEAPSVVGAGYTNPDTDPNTGTTLYDIDSALSILATQNPPNNGTLNTVGSLGLGFNDLLGFDIAPGNVAYAAVKAAPSGGRGSCPGATRNANSRLLTIDLATGDATEVGSIGHPAPIRGLAVALALPD